MLKPVNIDKEKHALSVVFAVIFCVSLVLILFERVKLNEEERGERQSEKLTMSAVQGAAAQQVAGYRQLVLAEAAQLGQWYEQLRSESSIDKLQAERAYHALVAMRVPALYQDLHFELVRIAHGLMNVTEENQHILTEQLRLAFERYPWISVFTAP